jgi:hypothetical protein
MLEFHQSPVAGRRSMSPENDKFMPATKAGNDCSILSITAEILYTLMARIGHRLEVYRQ